MVAFHLRKKVSLTSKQEYDQRPTVKKQKKNKKNMKRKVELFVSTVFHT